MIFTLVSGSAFTVAAILLIVQFRSYKSASLRHAEAKQLYEPVSTLEEQLKDGVSKYESLQSVYKSDLSTLREQEYIIAQYEVGVGTSDVSLCPPLPEGTTVESLESQLSEVKEKAKALVKAKKACTCKLGKDLAINGKKAGVKTFVNREIKMRLRCLDNEVKSAISLVNWNNIGRLEARVRNVFDEINEASHLMKTYLQKSYLELKLEELRLTFDIKRLKEQLREEEREERAALREQEKAEVQLAKAVEDTKRDREKIEALVASELLKINEATEQQRALLEMHQRELAILQEREARAVSMAQLTKVGYIYVITNEMSFGPGICKIGMTRRLDPMDRVRELGDASVPDWFKVHVFAYSDDAPEFEKFLHDNFSRRRVNKVNRRKEFFFVEPEEVKEALRLYDGKFTLEPVPE